MGKFITCIFWTLVYCQLTFGQSHGLGFSSHEVVPEKRTSLRLTPSAPLCLHGQTDLSFDLVFKPNLVTYFGYIVRLITADHQNVDLVYNQKLDVFNCVIGEKVTGSFKIDTARLRGEWNHIRIRLEEKTGEVSFFLENKPVCKGKLNLRAELCCNIFFGATSMEGFQTLDLPPMNIRDIRLEEDGKLTHFFPLAESQGGKADDTEGKHSAEVQNPVWLKPRHQNWEQVHNMTIPGTPGITFDQQKEILYIVTADTLFQYAFKEMKMHAVPYAQKLSVLPPGNLNVYDPAAQQLYNIYIDEKKAGRFDTTARKWDIDYNTTELTEYWQANKFFSAMDSSVYALGGYGQLRYKNIVQRYHIPTRQWEVLPTKGDHFMPRYMAALGLNSSRDTAFILGGYGSNTGDQSVNPKYTYDLVAYSIRDRNFKTMWRFPEPDRNFCFSNSLVIDTAAREYYALIYPTDRFNSSLQLIRGSLQKGEYQLMGDSIPYSFYDIRSLADLYYCPVSKKLVTVTLYNNNDNKTSVRIFTLDFPPNTLVPAATGNNIPYHSWWLLLPGILVIILFVYRRRKKAPVQAAGDIEPVSLPGHKEVAAIYLFGQFEVFDKEGNDITKSFTPLLKELFLLVLIHTYKDGKGISSEQLFDILWSDKSQKDARNNYSVNIVKLKAILEKIGTFHIGKESGKWKLEVLNDTVQIDHARFVQLCAQKNSMTRSHIQELLAIVNRGAFLRTVQYEWLDDIKSDISGEVIDIFMRFIAAADLHSDAELVVRLTHAVFLFDALNEEALAYRCRSLIALGRHGIAQEAYHKFAKEYKESYGQEFGRSFKDITQQG